MKKRRSKEIVCTVKKIRASKLFVDDVYQRRLSESRIDHLVANYKEMYVGVLTVKRRGNRYAIVNGQHKFTTVGRVNPGYKKANGHEFEFTCEILPDWVDEALAFVHLNDQKPVTKNDKFKALLQSKTGSEGDVQKAIVTELSAIGLELIFGAGRRSDSPVKKTKNAWTLEDMYRTLGYERFRFALQILELYKVDDEYFQSASLTSDFFNGLTIFLRSTERSNGSILAGLEYSGDKASNIRDEALFLSTNGYSRAYHVANLLEKSVKKGLRKIK